MNNFFELNNKLAIVTGSGRGIGKSLAFALANAGCDLILTSRSKNELIEVSIEIEKIGRKCLYFECDFADVSKIKGFYKNLSDQSLFPDILINNAGTEEVRPSFDVDEKLWDKIINTNLKGAFFSSQSFAQQLKSNNKPGSIINLGSLSSSIGIPTATAYTSSKSGILGMTKALSAEWANYNIRVNSIAPGYFRTSLTEVFYSDENWQKIMLNKIPMKRFGKMEDLHGITILLASDASSYITGQIFYIDGGFISSI
ncbi:SDR family oxidoreductase [SAR116 cluster bacterium]|nr:SDR family oxidoreductase [SAR116 cluster bacterium]